MAPMESTGAVGLTDDLPDPVCTKGYCKWRRFPAPLPRQRNALRVEVMDPCQKCGAMLNDGRIGGCDDDYLPCHFQVWRAPSPDESPVGEGV
jgi:hypothetical protein